MSIRTASAAVVLVLLIGGSEAGRAETVELKYFVEVGVPSFEAAKELIAAGFDIAGIDRKNATIGVVVNLEELARLDALGWPVTIRSTNSDVHAIAALGDYTSPQELSTFMSQRVAVRPTLCKKVTLKDALFAGQKQYAMLITKDVDVPNDRPSFILDAQHHAREVMTTEIAKDMIDYLTLRYGTDAQVRHWVDNINIWVVGSVNPDGGMYVFTNDNFWRKNRHPSCAVDNNRNYPTLWNGCNGSSASCSSEITRGAAPGSEPETQGLMQLTSDVRPFFTLSYHSYGEYILYPYGCSDPDEQSALSEVAQGLNAILPNDQGATGHYATGPVWSTIYLADGISMDTQYGQYGAYGYAIEVNSSGFQPDFATWRDVTVQRQRTAWMYFLDKTLDGPQIRGTVTDAATGLPLPATFSLQEVTFTHGEAARQTRANGRYQLLVHSNGTYHLSTSSPGYCTTTQAVVVGSGPATVNVALDRTAIPQGVAAVAAGVNAIDVSWQAVVNADQYRLLRSLDPGGPYTELILLPGMQTSYHDSPVSGVATYYYVVRAVHVCDSGNSAEAHAATTGACIVGPAFSGLTSVTNAATSTCALNLTWPSGATRCGGGVTYRVHRSTTISFVPAPDNVVASGLTGTSFTDHDGLSSATPYYYVVRAVEAVNGVDDGNGIALTAGPTGPSALGTWTDDAGDTGTASLAGTAPWSVQPTGGNAGPLVYATGTYGDAICSALTTPAITLQSASSLSFASKYDIEGDLDVGIVEVATAPTYATWTKLTVNYPDQLQSTGNACGIPTSGPSTVFSRSLVSPAYTVSAYVGSLSAYAGESVKLRWRFSSDSNGTGGAGWWVDDIAITNALIPSSCSAGLPASPKEPSVDGGMRASRASPGSGVDLIYTPGCGTLDNTAYWGTSPIAGAVTWTNAACALGNTGRGTFDPGNPPLGSFFYFVLVGQNVANESSYGTGASGERPDAVGVGACDKPQDLAGTCP